MGLALKHFKIRCLCICEKQDELIVMKKSFLRCATFFVIFFSYSIIILKPVANLCKKVSLTYLYIEGFC